MNNKFKEKFMEYIFLISACVSILALLLISVFIFKNGIPAINEIGWKNFIFGTRWAPSDIPPSFGILPMILGSIYVTIGAILFGVPVGILTAIYISYFAPQKLYNTLKKAINLLAGIPSIVYGFFGLIVLVPLVRDIFWRFETDGNSILTASILLGIMILPTIIGISESAIKAVPKTYYEGAIALGATHEEAVVKVIVPAAKSGIISSIILGVGRAIGETMAVVMVAGNQARMPKGIFKGVRTLTSNIVIEMGYAAELHRGALIGTGAVLFIFILIINIVLMLFKRRIK